jgi:hypothetical protein
MDGDVPIQDDEITSGEGNWLSFSMTIFDRSAPRKKKKKIEA